MDGIEKSLRFRAFVAKKIMNVTSVDFFYKTQKMMNKDSFIFRRQKNKFKCEEIYIEEENTNALVRTLVVEDKTNDSSKSKLKTAILWLHGGGYAIGMPEQNLRQFKSVFKVNSDIVFYAPAYTLSTSKPYPQALYDAYSTLKYIHDNHEKLGINPDNIIVVGQSAGGGLALALSLYARDLDEIKISYLMPLYPMIDDRMITPSSINNTAPVWDSVSNELAWGLYLYGLDEIPYYAAPSRSNDLSSLPSMYSFIGDIEPFYDETKIFFERLNDIKIKAELDVYPGCFHAFENFGVGTKIAKDATNKWVSVLDDMARERF